MELKDRLSIFIKEANISQKELAQITGYTEQSLSKFFTGNTKNLKSDFFIQLFEKFPDLNLYWLLLGKGEMRVPVNQHVFSKKDLENLSEKVKELKDRNYFLSQENQDLRSLLQSKEEMIEAKEEIIRLLKKQRE